MSAHCNKCGADITYPAGTWPIGRCEPCDLRDELKEVDHAIRDVLDILTGFTGVTHTDARKVELATEALNALLPVADAGPV